MKEIIGFTGGLCSGKDSWAGFFQREFGYEHRSTSNVTREYIAENDLGEPTRDLTREVSTYLRCKFGADYLMRKAIESVEESDYIAISGIYVVPEAVYIKKIGGHIINIVADDSLRYDRMSKRKRAGEIASYDEYMRLMTNDLNSQTTDQRLKDVIDMADYEIDGNIAIADIARCRKIAKNVLSLIRDGGRLL